MGYHFRNLVFEGGGVKGIAYVGAMLELEERGILPHIRRVAGTSAGAINATLAGLGYTNEEMREVLWDMDFNNFMDSSTGLIRNFFRLLRSYGWFKGDFCRNWLGDVVAAKTGSRDTTFAEAEAMRESRGFKSMYFMATNLCTGFSEVFSAEKTPDTRIIDAVRLSMSIPFFFAAERYGQRKDVYVDGGVLDNYPVKIFDRMRYAEIAARTVKTGYYDNINAEFLAKHPESSPYAYNKETLGFRLDSSEEISMFRDNKEPAVHTIRSMFSFVKNIAGTYLGAQSNTHLHSDDWQRTVYIDTIGVGATDFDLGDEIKNGLLESGREWTRKYFDWYDHPETEAANK